MQIFIKWVKEVLPTINISKEKWQEFKTIGVLDSDFFRADVMSSGGNAVTLTDKLKIILENDKYKYHQVFEGDLFSRVIDFTDGGEAYQRFWNKYERPPAPVYQKYILERHDLLVPQNIRETKGSFFTPSIWVKKSREYLAKVFGENWQEEYYVWDCAAGTGNLLAGLTNKYNVWASTIDETDVNTINTLIDIDDNLDLLPSHVFQFDFLNDSFDKLPAELRKIIDDPEKRKKLIVYINPPYAEAANYGSSKDGVSSTGIYKAFKETISFAINELFAQFFARIYKEMPEAKLASFGTLKYITASNFEKFRNYFKAEFKNGFICKANTFDNVKGQFPIGFLIWDFENKKQINETKCDILNNEGIIEGKKNFYPVNKGNVINDWLRNFYDKKDVIAYLRFVGPDFQANSGVYITSKPKESDVKESRIQTITKNNITNISIYFTVRHIFEHTWINHNDQFLLPNDGYKADIAFQNNCLIFTLFHGKNNIQAIHGVNHWIPFTEKEVGAKEKFESNFMSKFLKARESNHEGALTSQAKCRRSKEDLLRAPSSPLWLNFSYEANAVLDAGRELWMHYHAKIKNNNTASVNASFYDIREFFQGRNDAGKMNNKSTDETYNALIKTLRETLDALAKKIEPKIYEYGFLKE